MIHVLVQAAVCPEVANPSTLAGMLPFHQDSQTRPCQWGCLDQCGCNGESCELDVKLAGSCSQTGPHHDAHPFRRHSLLSTGSPPYGSIAEANMLKLITGDGIPCACLGRESEDASTFALCWTSKSQHNACPSSPTQALVVGDLRRCPIMAVPCP